MVQLWQASTYIHFEITYLEMSVWYIFYICEKKKKQPAICATLVHSDEKFKKVQKLQLFFNNNRLYKC